MVGSNIGWVTNYISTLRLRATRNRAPQLRAGERFARGWRSRRKLVKQPTMAARANTDQRRAQIVDGLLTVMAASGYEGATIVAIGKAVGLSSGLVHYHFATMEEVLLALVERLVRGVGARYQARVAGQTGAAARLHAWIDAHVARGNDGDPRAVVAWSLVGAEAVRNQAVRAAYQRAIEEQITVTRALVRANLEDQARATAGRDGSRLPSSRPWKAPFVLVL